MLSSKNDTIKELRSKLNQYEPNTDDLKEEDWGWVAEGDGTTSGNEMNIKLDLFNVTRIKAMKIFYNSFFGLYCIIYIFSWKINIGSFKVVFNLVKKYPTISLYYLAVETIWEFTCRHNLGQMSLNLI